MSAGRDGMEGADRSRETDSVTESPCRLNGLGSG